MRQFASTTEPQKQITNVSYWFFFGRNENLTFNISTNFAVGITGQFFEESILAYIEVDTKIKPFFACANRKRDK